MNSKRSTTSEDGTPHPDPRLNQLRDELTACEHERDQAVNSLGQEQLRREALQRRIEHLAESLEQLRSTLSMQSMTISELRLLEQDFATFRHSDPYLALRFVGRIVARIVPPGSRRRRAVKAAWRLVRPLLSKLVRIIQRPWRSNSKQPIDCSVPVGLEPGRDYPGYRGLRKIVYLIGCCEGESSRYRVANLVEALQAKGVEASIIYEGLDLAHVTATPPADILVLFRAAWSERLARVVACYRSQGTRIVFDVDDLVFDCQVVRRVESVQNMNEIDRADYIDVVDRYRKTLLASDHCTTTTDYLAGHLGAVGKPVSIIPNSINEAQLLASRQASGSPIVTQRPVIGYLSGTATHNRDFQAATEALLEVLAERDVALCIVGSLELDARFDAFTDRILRFDFMPYLEMLHFCKGFTINLAPLEMGNPFNEGKSELKIFEAGLVGVPTVASPVDSYERLIKHQETGFLAATKAEWKCSLLALLDDPELRARVGSAAREQALERFGIGRVIEDAVSHYLEILSKREPTSPTVEAGR